MMKIVYFCILMVLLFEATPLLFDFPQTRIYLSETDPSGAETIIYYSKNQYITERFLPISFCTVFVTGVIFIMDYRRKQENGSI